jgi:hypothetical protein
MFAVRVLNDLSALVDIAEDFSGVLKHCRALLGEAHASGGAMQQFGLQQPFELLEMFAQRGLTDTQSCRRASKVSLFGDSDKIAELFDIDH